MDKELVKGTRGLAADKFIVGESGKIRGTGKGKLPPEGLPRDLSDPKRALLSVCRGGGRFPPTETAPFQGYARRQRPTTWPTSVKRVPSNYNPKLTLPWVVPCFATLATIFSTTMDSSASFPAWGRGTNIATIIKLLQGGKMTIPS